MRILGICLAGLALGACNFVASTSDERLVDQSFQAAQHGRIVEFADTLSHDFLLAGFRGGLGSNPPREYLMHAVREIAESTQFVTLEPLRQSAISTERAAQVLNLSKNQVLQPRMSTVRLRAFVTHGGLGEFRDIGFITIIRAQVADCSLALAAAGECADAPTTVEKISSFSITDPCLLASERRQHDCR